MSKVHMMLDLETLGTRPGSIVLSVAALMFDPADGKITAGTSDNIDIPAQMRMRMTVDDSTLEWWAGQPDAAWKAATRDPSAPAYVVKRITELVSKHAPDRIYAQGQDFDFPLFAALCRAVGAEVPWPHWRQRDTRTAYEEIGFDPKSVARTGTHHSAKDDCKHQIKCLQMARGRWVDQPTREVKPLEPLELESK